MTGEASLPAILSRNLQNLLGCAITRTDAYAVLSLTIGTGSSTTLGAARHPPSDECWRHKRRARRLATIRAVGSLKFDSLCTKLTHKVRREPPSGLNGDMLAAASWGEEGLILKRRADEADKAPAANSCLHSERERASNGKPSPQTMHSLASSCLRDKAQLDNSACPSSSSFKLSSVTIGTRRFINLNFSIKTSSTPFTSYSFFLSLGLTGAGFAWRS